MTAEVLEPGTIFESNWGYEQTNIDFYKLVKPLTATGFGTFQKIGASTIQNTRGRTYLVPNDLVEIGTPKRRKVRFTDYGVYFSVCSYAVASLWDGKPAYDTIAAGDPGH